MTRVKSSFLFIPPTPMKETAKCGFTNWNSGPAVLWVDESFEKRKLMANLWKSVVAGPSTEIHSKHSHINRPPSLKKGGLRHIKWLAWWKWSICEGLMLHTVWWQNEELCQRSPVLIEGRSRRVMTDNEFLAHCAGFFFIGLLSSKAETYNFIIKASWIGQNPFD